MTKEVREAAKRLARLGFEVRPGRRRNPHPVVLWQGRVVTRLPSTPSDWRGVKNTEMYCRRWLRRREEER